MKRVEFFVVRLFLPRAKEENDDSSDIASKNSLVLWMTMGWGANIPTSFPVSSRRRLLFGGGVK